MKKVAGLDHGRKVANKITVVMNPSWKLAESSATRRLSPGRRPKPVASHALIGLEPLSSYPSAGRYLRQTCRDNIV